MQQYTFNKYFAKKSFLKIFGGEIRIFDESKNKLLFFVKQKAFKLKEDISVYADETKTKELLKIKARSVIDFSAIYDVVDVTSNEAIGSLRRKGFKSILKDSWEILDTKDQVIGSIDEDSMFKAILRRFLTNLIPQSFFITLNKNQVGVLKQTFNPFVPQFNIDFSSDNANALDRRMGIAIVILLQIIEGRQQ
ncbi:hypothetical protein [Leptospira kanakyensis]|uniref:Scramblase n=1 Tax=Leptospira kanakyensis TaxID=2484968 RepID=A0A6N4PZL8_9LEPT|nr:hypothetical protein [Leptospira kanakyensis]MCW7469251.1 hypothetical protein [Leptospira kanakyensis]MCW7480240.1 hypothetical protein [Leptospira kanakyensis]TGK50441.1 hypothetical protein EHQ11_12170 [Leptospira kanakyensis]TGK63957.1 hypothetical protein EHQ16_05850 [Leptospira kanakyensis]TGK69579.1 hypothetical protein EHQ18_12330 [Leptospira kanakyensis]